jgi:hypothetical protein
MNAQYLVIVGLSGIALASCRSSSSDSQASSASSTAALTDEALDQATIPVKEDFEEQARQTVTADNLDEQLSELEKQITEDR